MEVFRAAVQRDSSGFGQIIAKEALHEVDRRELGLAHTNDKCRSMVNPLSGSFYAMK